MKSSDAKLVGEPAVGLNDTTGYRDLSSEVGSKLLLAKTTNVIHEAFYSAYNFSVYVLSEID